MSTVLTTTAAIVIILSIAAMRSAPAFARGNFDRVSGWSPPTVHDAASYHDYRDYRALTVPVNYHPGHAGPPVHGPPHRKR